MKDLSDIIAAADTVVLQPQPNERQKEFLRCKKKYIAFGGARGGGKSWAVRTKARLLGLRYPGIRMLLIRRTYQELENNHIRFLRQELHGLAEYRHSARQFAFRNGSVLDFGYCASEGDLDRYQGAEYDIIFIDEATQLHEEWLRQFAACLRGVNDFPKRIYYTCNPGGASHSYFKRLFIDRQYEPGEDPADYTFIQSLVTDNKALMESQPDYIKQLEALPPKLKEAWLYGKWDLFEGQFFEDFRTQPDSVQCAAAGITPGKLILFLSENVSAKGTNSAEGISFPFAERLFCSYNFGIYVSSFYKIIDTKTFYFFL